MSAMRNATASNEPIGRPNWCRARAYGTAASSAACARPSASAPIEIRPPSRIVRNVRKPLPSSPRRLPAGIRAPSNRSSPVADAWSPSFSSSRPTENPGVSAGTMNALISAAPLAFVPVRAATMYVPAWPALVMNRLPPLSSQHAPSSVRVAVVRIPPASEPALGSVSPYPPMTLPLASGTRNSRFCSSVPARRIGPQPSDVWAATISPSEPQTRPISSIAIA